MLGRTQSADAPGRPTAAGSTARRDLRRLPKHLRPVNFEPSPCQREELLYQNDREVLVERGEREGPRGVVSECLRQLGITVPQFDTEAVAVGHVAEDDDLMAVDQSASAVEQFAAQPRGADAVRVGRGKVDADARTNRERWSLASACSRGFCGARWDGTFTSSD